MGVLRLLGLSCLLTIFFPLHAERQVYLQQADVHPIMEQIIAQHVEQNSVNATVLRRSFKVYIDQFDPDRLYLLDVEVEPFLNLSDSDLERIQERYRQGDFSFYRKLDEVIARAIARARHWRGDLLKENLDYVFSEENLKDLEEDAARESDQAVPFAKDREELKSRIRDNQVLFIRHQQKRLKGRDRAVDFEKLVGLYERYVRSFEAEYLYQTDSGARLSAKKREDEFTLHILKALASSLDSHTAFFDPDEAYEMKVRLEKGFHGIGVVLEDSIEGIRVVRLIEGGPAERSERIQEGDRLTEVNGRELDGIPFDDVMGMIRGRLHTRISLGFERGDGEKTRFFRVRLKREKITLQENRVETSTERFGEGIIATIRLHSFYEGDAGISSERDVRDALKQLNKQGPIKGLVLDLRDNLGGFLMQAVKVAGLFISNGVVVVSKYSGGQEHYFRDLDGRIYYNGPMVVLTSKSSASAAEIVAQTLQDYGAAIVVGDARTYGKGSIQHQTVTESEDESLFKVTVGRYYTVSGRSTQLSGVVADIVVPGVLNWEEVGEAYLDFPLASDVIPPAYHDALVDIDEDMKGWYHRYYLPSVQPRVALWKDLVPALRANSLYRIRHNANYQAFLRSLAEEDPEVKEDPFLRQEVERLALEEEKKDSIGENDLQMAEALNIVKDMILLRSEQQSKNHGIVISK